MTRILRSALGIGFMLFVQSAMADFSGAFAVANWTTPQSFFCLTANVNTAGAPASVAISAGCGTVIQGFKHNGAPSNGTITFNYSGYNNVNTIASYDVGGPGTAFPAAAAGSITLPVTAGQLFQITLTNNGGSGPITISNFTFTPAGGPASVPTLSEWTMAALASFIAMFGFVVMRRRQR